MKAIQCTIINTKNMKNKTSKPEHKKNIYIDKAGKQYSDLYIDSNVVNIKKRGRKQFQTSYEHRTNRPIPSHRLWISLLTIFLIVFVSTGFARDNVILCFNDSIDDLLELNLVAVEGGTFLMGDDNGDENEKPVHEVELDDFEIGRYEVSNTQYAIFLNEYKGEIVDEGERTYVIAKDGDYKGQKLIDLLGGFEDVKCRVYADTRGIFRSEIGFEHYPVLFVSWFGAYEYCRFYGLSLPTEAQWEYASRGGKKKDKNEFGKLEYAGSNNLNKVAWWSENSNQRDHNIGMKKANPLGLYDMTGNIAEWCLDWYGFYKKDKQKNPKGNDTGISRVLRGGSWFVDAELCRNNARMNSSPDTSTDSYGFRYVKNH